MALCTTPSTVSEYVIAYTPIAISFAAFCVSIIVVVIGIRQSNTATEKLRLDLYNRRFAIYEAAVTFYRARYRSSNNPLTDEEITNMVLAVRESKFLFDSKDGVMDALNRFRSLVQSEHHRDGIELESLLKDVEESLGKYLNFHNIR